ncbi:MAG: DUF2029 domain-containing protein [Chloroflexi bacterium]|nr:DUF2029 domain-containing protein [Chloroflexota bacterium]
MASFVVRGDAAGADFEVYWTAAREWLAGGDPYDLPSDVLPYVYAPWGLPLFVPWSLLPWDAAFTLWRMMTLLGLMASLRWAAMRRPLSTAAVFATLAIPIGINLDTGNVTLPLALVIFGSRFGPPWAAGVAWGAATGLKWATMPIGIVLGRVARRWGLIVIAAGVILSVLLWPMTLDQLRTIANLERPFPWDYFVLAWAAVPWLWTDPTRRRWLRPRTWAARARHWVSGREDDRRRRILPPTRV